MVITKQQIIDTINALPGEEFHDVDVVINELILLEKIKKGLAAIEDGNIIPEEDADKEIEKW